MSGFDDYRTPVCRSKGRRWSLLKVPKSFQFSEPNVQNDAHVITESDVPYSDPLVCEGPPTSHESDASVEQQVFSSTPIPNTKPPDVVTAMSDIISQVGQQTADSTVTRLNQTHSVNTHTVSDSSKNVMTDSTASQIQYSNSAIQSQLLFPEI